MSECIGSEFHSRTREEVICTLDGKNFPERAKFETEINRYYFKENCSIDACGLEEKVRLIESYFQ